MKFDDKTEDFLIKNGYKQKQPGLWNLWIKPDINLYHDYRKGDRFSYAFKGKDKVEVTELIPYLQMKDFEELSVPDNTDYTAKHTDILVEDYTEVCMKIDDSNDDLGKLLYHLNGLIESMNVAKIQHSISELKEVLRKLNYKIKNGTK